MSACVWKLGGCKMMKGSKLDKKNNPPPVFFHRVKMLLHVFNVTNNKINTETGGFTSSNKTFFFLISKASHNELQIWLHLKVTHSVQWLAVMHRAGKASHVGSFMVSCVLTATLQQNKDQYFDRNSYRRISLRVKNVQSCS